MPGSGPPVPDDVLDALRKGATFYPIKSDLGALLVDGVPYRLAIKVTVDGSRWVLDPDAGSYVTRGTFAALAGWASSTSGELRFDDLRSEIFAPGLYPESEGGIPIARVAIVGPAGSAFGRTG